MRLTCPNCNARYEVADDMIPAEGRDVQCSNCSTTWFQPSRSIVAADAALETSEAQEPIGTEQTSTQDASGAPAEPAPTQQPRSVHVQRQAPLPPEPSEPEPDTAPEPVIDPADPFSAPADMRRAAAATAAATATRTPRRELDDSVRDILQQEADREARLREAEAEPVEMQEEMQLESGAQVAPRPELEDAEDAFELDDAMPELSGARRDLFPDIDEINSTLRDTGDRSSSEADTTDIDALDALPKRRRGVRIGFLVVLAVAAGAVTLYANADRVGDAVPTMADPLDTYTARVDTLRFWLDDLARGLAGQTSQNDG